MSECIFCKIIAREIPAEIVFEDETVLAFKDRSPIAPVHVLIIPKKHVGNINELQEEDAALAGHMIMVAKKLAADLQIAEKGYKLLFRVGKWGGQEVEHIHLHLIGGAKLHEEIRPI